MLAIPVPFIGSRQYKQRGPGTIAATLPSRKRLQHHLRTLLGYKTSQEEHKFQIVGDSPLATKTSRGGQFRGHVNSVTAHHDLTVWNPSDEQFLAFLLRSRNQAGRSSQHSTANSEVVE